ncbi:M50 family metallopeptidase [Canibacter oris]|uniref:Membrane-associated protease RseP (Regulator of RpoE activity) n=1 Tax=Canibacter oris TaxID=1365628 RepID=A0A840DSN4_9MICO|nr:M50 family metallopeptidase [Canibacter oris]MBB4072146.1 membrane-associated protease RseP (regulator of RpoE activity) [Canibacter oris]
MSATLQYALGVGIVLLGVGISIALHELGHLLPAKLFGVKVTKYMVGFGPTLWSRHRGETEYGVKLLPLGGFVALHQMTPPPHPAADPAADRATDSASDPAAANNAAAVTTAATDTADSARAFWRLTTPRKIAVMFGGPAVNLVLGCVLLAVLVCGIGVPQQTTTVGTVAACLEFTATADGSCDSSDPQSPAAAAGLQPGDKILAINSEPLSSWQQARTIFGENPEQPLQLTILRDEQQQTLTLTPAAATRVRLDANGAPEFDAVGNYVTEAAGVAGLSPAVARVQQPLTAVPHYIGEQLTGMTTLLLQFPQRIAGVWDAAFSDSERELNGPISVVGVGRLAGEISATEQLDLADKAGLIVGLLAGLNIALFVFNMLPLLPLDGGHIAGALYEGARRQLYRLLGKPDPGAVDVSKMFPLTILVILVFGAVSLLVIYADIVKPITLGQ